MSIMGTFDTMTAARLGIYAAQKGLSVTGNNIANINTEGYTRQNLDQVALKTGGSDRYQYEYAAKVGNGVLCTSVSQTRDAYLDIRYRTQEASVGAMETTVSGLNDVAGVLDEVGDGDDSGDGIVEAQLNDLYEMLQNLSTNAGHDDYESLVRSSASSLCILLNSYAKQLAEVKENTQDELSQCVDEVNEILSNIRALNAQIRKSEIHGDNALELRDDRNVLLDNLSKYMKIDVTYEMEDLGGGQSVEKLVVKLGNANADASVTTDSSTLIDGIYATQLTVGGEDDYYAVSLSELTDSKGRGQTVTTVGDVTSINETDYQDAVNDSGETPDQNGKLVIREEKNENGMITTTVTTYQKITTVETGKYDDGTTWTTTTFSYTKQVTTTAVSQKVDLEDNDLYGSLQSYRELLTEEGEFASSDDIDLDEDATTKRGIPYYQKALDLLANQIATQFNALNQGYRVDSEGNYLMSDGSLIKDANGDPINTSMTLDQDQQALLDAFGDELGGVLFSNNGAGNDDTGITAANISISKDWANGSVAIVNSFTETVAGQGIPSTANENVERFVNLFTKKTNYYATTVVGDADTTDSIFYGTFQEMLTNISADLGKDIRSDTVLLDTYDAAATELDSNRESVSGVDLNDEAMNLMTYQKAYQAACRLMTTMDEVLDKLINGTAV